MTTFETLHVDIATNGVATVTISNGKANAMSTQFFHDIGNCFTGLSTNNDVRVVVLQANGKYFTVGLDLKDATTANSFGNEHRDVARKVLQQRKHVLFLQSTFTALENCPQPIIMAVHGACIGGGIDLSCCCDIRLACEQAWFCIKEVDVGLCADLGTLQRLPKVMGNGSALRELAYTARRFEAREALELGLVSRVYENPVELRKNARMLADEIASKSPVAVYGTKVNLNFSRDHSVGESLEYQATWSSSALQSEDLPKSFIASLNKERAEYSKL
jgi:delta(3,5)-delta(2,4)-dienoyl-CoA isomerase